MKSLAAPNAHAGSATNKPGATPDELLTYIPYPVSSSSESFGWQQVRVEVWRKPPPEGEIVCPAGTHHELIVPLCGGNTTTRSFGELTWVSNAPQLLNEWDFIPAGCDNRWQWHGGACEYASFDIDPRFVADAFWCKDEPFLPPIAGVQGGRIRRIATLLVDELEAGNPNGKLQAETLMLSLAANLFEQHSGVRLPAFAYAGPGRISRVVDYIRSHLETPLALAELAGIAGLSQWHFCVAFRRATNTSPRQFVVSQRIQRAVALLGESPMTVTEIAFDLGFSGQAHFSSSFIKHTGVSPSAYRARFRRS
ncbi:MAG: helix-turn-helix transcriptional regulator [Acidobacteriaceae bacterium]|nr:helix-turn-helix transcriptional regulator [Acidobacteriaceae bacterium]